MEQTVYRRHLSSGRNLLDVIVLKTKKVEDLLLYVPLDSLGLFGTLVTVEVLPFRSSDEDEDLLQGPGIGDLKALTGASSKAPGSAIGKASTTGKKATPGLFTRRLPTQLHFIFR